MPHAIVAVSWLRSDPAGAIAHFAAQGVAPKCLRWWPSPTKPSMPGAGPANQLKESRYSLSCSVFQIAWGVQPRWSGKILHNAGGRHYLWRYHDG